MASKEPDRLRSCKTLNAGIQMVDGQLGGLDVSKLDEQIRVARMQFYHDSTIQNCFFLKNSPLLFPAAMLEAATEQLQSMQMELGLTSGMDPQGSAGGLLSN